MGHAAVRRTAIQPEPRRRAARQTGAPHQLGASLPTQKDENRGGATEGSASEQVAAIQAKLGIQGGCRRPGRPKAAI